MYRCFTGVIINISVETLIPVFIFVIRGMVKIFVSCDY